MTHNSPRSDVTNDQILQMLQNITSKMETMQTSLDELRVDQNKIEDRVKQVEQFNQVITPHLNRTTPNPQPRSADQIFTRNASGIPRNINNQWEPTSVQNQDRPTRTEIENPFKQISKLAKWPSDLPSFRRNEKPSANVYNDAELFLIAFEAVMDAESADKDCYGWKWLLSKLESKDIKVLHAHCIDRKLPTR